MIYFGKRFFFLRENAQIIKGYFFDQVTKTSVKM